MFKVGDRVRMIDRSGEAFDLPYGAEGTVVTNRPECYGDTTVKMDNPEHRSKYYDTYSDWAGSWTTDSELWALIDAGIPEAEETILEEAQRLVYGDRQKSYGHPKSDFTRTAMMWTAILGHEVTAEQAALCMCAVKISRQVNKSKRDNMVDLAGYAAVVQKIIDWDGEE